MDLEFSGELWHWRGPAPHHFVWVPEDDAAVIADVARAVTYGWGMVPATVTIGATEWTTALWPKEGRYVVPVKARIREAERLDLGDVVSLRLQIQV